MSDRGTTNTNDRGSAKNRRDRKHWLLDTFGDGTWADCFHCGIVLDFGTLTVDRIVPGILGGKYTRNNIRPACMTCNSLDGTSLRERLKKGLVPA
jgi:5-methylcytosine-specific restriction endonuclease McrA